MVAKGVEVGRGSGSSTFLLCKPKFPTSLCFSGNKTWPADMGDSWGQKLQYTLGVICYLGPYIGLDWRTDQNHPGTGSLFQEECSLSQLFGQVAEVYLV